MDHTLSYKFKAIMAALLVFSNEGTTDDKFVGSNLQKEFWDIFDDSNLSFSKFPLAIVSFDPNATFSSISPDTFFFDRHSKFMAAIRDFKNMLLGLDTTRDLLRVAKMYKCKMNRHLWLQGFFSALLEKVDGPILFPALVELLPDLMIPYTAIDEALQVIKDGTAHDDKCFVTINGESGKVNGVENSLWYFREDLMVNSQHWYWHMQYPLDTKIIPDRQGELFYHMHHNIMARYHAERLSNGLNPVIPLVIKLGNLIEEPYYSLLRDFNSGQMWANRPRNTIIRNIERGSTQINVSAHEIFGNRLHTAVEAGILITPTGMEERALNITNFLGINYLSLTAEATFESSVNSEYYGKPGWHNSGHGIISNIADPDNSLRLPQGVMSDTATAMRDVAFYTWHASTDNLFTKYKSTLPPYQPQEGEFKLTWPGISVDKIKIHTKRTNSSRLALNELYTFWNTNKFDISKGLDLKGNATIRGPMNVCVDHLNHDEFIFEIIVFKNSSVPTSNATIRIFMAPRFNENGQRYSMEEQRLLFFVLDTFSFTLTDSHNVIIRNSADSLLTLPYSKSFRQLQEDELTENPWCGCGWPHHLLIPKGKPSGMIFDVFVMITNGDEDSVPDEPPEIGCKQGYLFCGRINRKYPDSKPMGYPVDRKVFSVKDTDKIRPVADLEEYISGIPNMNAVQVTIFHEKKRKERSFTAI